LRSTHYSAPAIFLHWITAALILTNWLLPQLTEFLAKSSVPRVIALHRSIGVTVLVLVLLRAAWRFFNPAPALPGGTAQLVRIGAHLGHAALYLLMLAVPVFGILFTWAGGRGLSIWGLPEIAPPTWIDPDWHDSLRALHETSANAILWLVAFHVGAALIHHYVFRDGLIDRMLPARLRRARQQRSALI